MYQSHLRVLKVEHARALLKYQRQVSIAPAGIESKPLQVLIDELDKYQSHLRVLKVE